MENYSCSLHASCLFFLLSLHFIPFMFSFPFNLTGTMRRSQADKCTETLLAFNLFLDKCNYCCRWYRSLVQQSSEELAHPFFTVCHYYQSLKIVIQNIRSWWKQRIKPQGFRKLLSYSSSATHIQTPCWWFFCPEENILLLPQTCLLALCHLQVMIKLQQRDFFLISQFIVCTLDSPPFVLTFSLDNVEKSF